MKRIGTLFARNRAIDIAADRDAITQNINPAARLVRVQRSRRSCQLELDRTNGRIVKSEQLERQLEHHPGNAPGSEMESRGNRSVAVALAAGGLVTQFAVNAAALGHLGMSVVVAATIGLEVFLGTVGVALLLSVADKDRPERTLRVGRNVSLVLTVTVLAAAAVALAARFSTESTGDGFFSAAALSVYWIAEIAPVAGGIWLALAEMRVHPQRVVEELEELRTRAADLRQHADWLREEEARLVVGPASRGARQGDHRVFDASRVAGLSRSVLMVVWLAGSLMVSGNAGAQACGVASQRSISSDVESRREAVNAVAERLDEFIISARCRTLVVGSFAEGAAFTPRTLFTVVPAPRTEQCTATSVKAKGSQGAIAVFAGFRAREARIALETCLARVATAESSFALSRRRLRSEVRAALAQPLLTTASRTDIAGMLQSFIDVGVRDVLLVSNGIDSSSGIPERLPPETRVLVVLFDAKENFGGRQATEAAGERWRRAGANVLPWAMITPGVIQRLSATRSR